jgi:hypothetical protein
MAKNKYIGKVVDMMEIFNGADGKPSGRRIIGTILILWGSALLSPIPWTLAQGSGMWDVIGMIAPGSVIVLVGAYFWGLITSQNIKSFIEAGKK